MTDFRNAIPDWDDIESELDLANKIWTYNNGNVNLNLRWPSEPMPPKDMLAQSLIDKGVLRYHYELEMFTISPATKQYIANGGQTNKEVQADRDNQRQDDAIEISKKSLTRSTWAIIIAGLAFLLSVVLAITKTPNV